MQKRAKKELRNGFLRALLAAIVFAQTRFAGKWTDVLGLRAKCSFSRTSTHCPEEFANLLNIHRRLRMLNADQSLR